MPNEKMERFTQRARRALNLAQVAAEEMKHNVIDTEHLLLGLMREEGGVAGRVLRDLGVELLRVEELVDELTQATQRKTSQMLDLSAGTKNALELGVDEARKLGHRYIGTEHLLLGLLLVNRAPNTAVAILGRCGVTPDEIRQGIFKIFQESPVQTASPFEPEAAPRPRPPVPPLESVRRQGLPMTSQGQAFQVLTAAITHILDMVDSHKLTPAQAAEILGGLQPYLKPSTSEAAHLIALSLVASLPEERNLHVVVRDLASGVVKLEVVVPLVETLESLDSLVSAAASDYVGWLWMTDMDDKNRIEVRVEAQKEEDDSPPAQKDDDDAQ